MNDQPEAYRTVVYELLADPTVSEAKMMGMATVKVGKKMFGGLAADGSLALKLGTSRAAELFASGRGAPFDPSGRGRPMGGWVMLAEPSDDWLQLAEEAKEFTREV
jgi:hypothetical protein